ncbi:MAG: hypothetical protein S4CHLAM7_10500 [Chlamydiae bacterium]|nr:hypothetical protein [Chlamydiota bacterium]
MSKNPLLPTSNLTIPKTLVIGQDSFVGGALYTCYKKQYPGIVATSRDKNKTDSFFLDLNNPSLTKLNLTSKNFSQAVICAGITDIAYCEKHPDLSYKINVVGVLETARQLAKHGIKPICFSTDIVFDGLQNIYLDNSNPAPLNEYAKQKAELEKKLPSVCGPNHLILRISKTYSTLYADNTLLSEIIKKFTEKQIISAATDLYFRPLEKDDLINAILNLQSINATGIFNLCGPTLMSWYEIASAIGNSFSFCPELVKKIKIDSLNSCFQRPKKLNLCANRFEALFPNFKFQSIEESILKIKLNFPEEIPHENTSRRT